MICEEKNAAPPLRLRAISRSMSSAVSRLALRMLAMCLAKLGNWTRPAWQNAIFCSAAVAGAGAIEAQASAQAANASDAIDTFIMAVASPRGAPRRPAPALVARADHSRIE